MAGFGLVSYQLALQAIAELVSRAADREASGSRDRPRRVHGSGQDHGRAPCSPPGWACRSPTATRSSSTAPAGRSGRSSPRTASPPSAPWSTRSSPGCWTARPGPGPGRRCARPPADPRPGSPAPPPRSSTSTSGYDQAMRRVGGDEGRPLLARPDLAALYQRRLARLRRRRHADRPHRRPPPGGHQPRTSWPSSSPALRYGWPNGPWPAPPWAQP